MRDLSIYVHIPFCVRKCRYCDFLSFPGSDQEKETYLELLLTEIEKQAFLYKNHSVISVFIGGGTPSILENGAIKRILDKLNLHFTMDPKAEITVEANPGTLTGQKLSEYRQAGVNRLSIGLQSADEKELRTLGRIHDYRTFLHSYEMARNEGFQNINVDLISAIPGQSIDSYRGTLEKILALAPEHISAYSLIMEEGTWFYEHQQELDFPSEEEDRQLYEITGDMLLASGYMRYEISNYAKAGFECLHNQVYWKRGDYAGFGTGAASMVEEVRWSNPGTMEAYASALQKAETAGAPLHAGEADRLSALRTRFGQNIQYLTRKEQMEEFMFLGLRLTAGISRHDFLKKFGVPIESVYGETLVRLAKEGLLCEEKNMTGSIALTPYGMDISNYVMAQFLLES